MNIKYENMKKLYKRMNEDCCDPQQPNGIKDLIWNNQLQSREIVLNQEINEESIERVVIQILNFNDMDSENDKGLFELLGKEVDTFNIRQPIKLLLNTPGGNIDEAFSIISAITTSKTPVHCISLGKCWSAGFLILLAGHLRSAQLYSSLMYHGGSGGFVGEFSKHYEVADQYKKIQDMVEEYVKQRTKIPKKKLLEVFSKKQDWFMTSKEALELGVIDSII